MMMEETSDDTNGESTFEFVGDKIDEALLKDDLVSSTTPNIDSVIPTTVDPVSTNLMLFTTTVTESLSPSINPSVPPPPLPATTLSTSASNLPPQASIPMYDPSKPMGMSSGPFVSLRSPVSPTQAFYQPISSVSPPQPSSQPQQSLPPAQNPYSQTSLLMHAQNAPSNVQLPPTQQVFTPPGMASIPQAALDLPVDDNFVSSSGQTFQDAGNERGVWGWIKGNEFLNKVAEKAKNSVDSVITTLDPGMKEIIYSGGDISLVVASGNEPKISAIREAFQQVFGKATVEGIAVQSMTIAPQPVGYSAGAKAAEERINNLRQQGLVHEHQVVVAIENFLAELTPDKWFDLGCILLQDPLSRINLQIYTEAIPVENHFVMQAKEQTPPDFPLGWSGFAVTIGQVVGPALGVHHSEWHQALTGISRREILFLAAKTIAGLYKTQLRR